MTLVRAGDVVHKRYHINQRIGIGGMGAVFVATDEVLKRPVALKQLLANGDQSKRAFKREAQLLANLEHPAIPNVLDHFTEDDNHFLVMQYIPGDNLADLLRQRGAPFEVERVLSWGAQLLNAVGYLHTRATPIIHRDIKPANLKLREDERVVLLDFGIAKGTAGEMTQAADTHGPAPFTPGYASPEQREGTELDGRSDLYAVAATLYVLLTRTAPVDALERMRCVALGKLDPLLPAHEVNPAVPAAVSRTMEQALALNRDERPANATTFAATLHAAAQLGSGPDTGYSATTVVHRTGTATEAHAAGRVGQALQSRPWAVRPRQLLAVLAIMLVLLGGWRLAQSIQSVHSLSGEMDATRPMGVGVPSGSAPIGGANAALVTELGHWGSGSIVDVAAAPDGKQLAVASSLGIVLYDPQSLQQTRLISTTIGVRSVAFSADSTLIAAGMADHAVRLWRVADGSLVNTLQAHQKLVIDVAFAPDGRTLASASDDGTVRVWRLPDGRPLHTLENAGSVWSVAYSPDSRFVASGSFPRTLRVWHVADGTPVWENEDHGNGVVTVAFAPDGRTLASGSFDNTVRLWRTADGQPLATLTGHSNAVLQVAFSEDGRSLTSGSFDNTVRLWDVASHDLLRTLTGHSGYVISLAMLPGGQTLASAAWDNTVRLWNVADGSLVSSLAGHSARVYALAFAPETELIAANGNIGVVELRRAPDGTLVHSLAGHTGIVSALAFAPDGQTVAAGAADGTVHLWRVADGSLLRRLPAGAQPVRSITFSPDGRTLAAASGATVQLWRTADGGPVRQLTGHSGVITSLAFAPDGALLATGSEDRTVRLWRAADGMALRELPGHQQAVTSVEFAPREPILVSGSVDQVVRVWNVEDGTLQRLLMGHTAAILSLAFTADGDVLGSASADHTIQLWNVVDGSRLQTLDGHLDEINSLVVAPSGTALASGSSDGTIRFWGIPVGGS